MKSVLHFTCRLHRSISCVPCKARCSFGVVSVSHNQSGQECDTSIVKCTSKPRLHFYQSKVSHLCQPRRTGVHASWSGPVYIRRLVPAFPVCVFIGAERLSERGRPMSACWSMPAMLSANHCAAHFGGTHGHGPSFTGLVVAKTNIGARSAVRLEAMHWHFCQLARLCLAAFESFGGANFLCKEKPCQ
jgi:hypothetical protein